MLADIDALNLKAAVSDAVLYGFDFGALVATYYRRDAGNRYGLFKLNMGGAPELQDAAQRYIQVFTPIIKKFSKRWLTQPDILKRELDALANAFVEYVHAHAK
jgi:hypothetical protein